MNPPTNDVATPFPAAGSIPSSIWNPRPMDGPVTLSSCMESLLKQPGQILYECSRGNKGALLLLTLLVLGCLATFGLLLGSISGGTQWWAAPLKVVVGTLLAGGICLPSLYIFLALDGKEAGLSQVITLVLAALGLTGLLLVGFAPVLWVFSQSTTSLGFLGSLAILFWVISLSFGLRLIHSATAAVSRTSSSYLGLWMLIFLVVTLQMSTALRPLIGSSNRLLPAEKRFFVHHWMESAKETVGEPGAWE
jgi:hypothetical protein